MTVNIAELYAHRGASTIELENTLPAFRKASELGVPGIELDVQWLSTGEIAVYHDEDVSNYFYPAKSNNESSKNSILSAMDFTTMKKLESKEEVQHPGIPLLSEVFEAVGSQMAFDIEIKGYVLPNEDQLKQLLKLIKSAGFESQTIVSSFDPRILMSWKSLGSKIPAGLIYDGGSKEIIKREAPWKEVLKIPDFEKPHYLLEADIHKALSSDTALSLWTIDDAALGMSFIKKGVEGIISNAPQNYTDIIANY